MQITLKEEKERARVEYVVLRLYGGVTVFVCSDGNVFAERSTQPNAKSVS